MKILVVEDHAQGRQALCRLLQATGHRCLPARDGDAAWEMLQAHSDIHVVITDWDFAAGVDGLEVCRLARTLSGRYVYFIMITDVEHRAQLASALQQGVDAFIVKPVDVSELQAHLNVAQRIINLENDLESKMQRLVDARMQLLDAEREKRRFCRDVLRVVTHDRLHLVERQEMPRCGRSVGRIELHGPRDLAEVRRAVRKAGLSLAMDEDRLDNFLVAVGEATTNALRHAADALCEVRVDGDRILTRVSDHGKGISLNALPASVLQTGYSTKLSLGAGFEVMRNMADEIWLATGPRGTVLLLAKYLVTPKVETVSATETLLGKLGAAELANVETSDPEEVKSRWMRGSRESTGEHPVSTAALRVG